MTTFAAVMSTILFPSPIYGPVHSRRLGVSLGVNLMPEDGKMCTFDCIYCECGYNKDHHTSSARPTREQVRDDLKAQLEKMVQEGMLPDVITFAGNGEPTSHPHFPEIIDDTIMLRDKYCPKAQVSVLSNSTFIHRRKVMEALMKVDNNILKLDTVDNDYIRVLDQPQSSQYDVNDIIAAMKQFNGKLIIQTIFLRGSKNGVNVDNTSDKYVEPWLKVVSEIHPESVMIYTIDRETPDKDLIKASKDVLDSIGKRVEDLGIPCSVSY